MVERTFLNTIRTFLADNLPNPPILLGSVEPAENNELPAIVLSLEHLNRPASGLGERSALITDGALPWTATIDLANPVLPDEPTFSLLSPDRRQLVLPHGGLVRADGSAGLLSAGDFSVTVAGALRTLVTGPPGANEVRVDPLVGQLTFGAALPLQGNVVANYILGQWEQRVARLEGSLKVRVVAETIVDAEDLSNTLMELFTDTMPQGVERIAVSGLGTIVRLDGTLIGARSRTIVFEFEYEAVVNRPDSSGGIIQRIPVTTLLAS